MLLIFCSRPQTLIGSILLFIENHSVLVGAVTSVIVSSLWLKKFLNQKRAEAFFGFYSKLSLSLKTLQSTLEENEQLDVSDDKNGNIFSLIYIKDYMKDICPKYRIPDDADMELYKAAAQELIQIFLKTENNVYPHWSNRKKWYESEYIVFSFCKFLENKASWHTTNIGYTDGVDEPKHVIKCKSLIEAMNYIQGSISRVKY